MSFRNLARIAGLMVCAAAPAPVLAQSAAQVEAQVGTQGKQASPFRGSFVRYGHSATALSLAPSGEPYYNPTWLHRLSVLPQWFFSEQFFLRGRLFLTQELTPSDSTTFRNEVEVADIAVDLATTGWTEPNTRVRIAGDVRFMLPTSKISQAATRRFSVGPNLNLSRLFSVGSGHLFTGYQSRFTTRFHRFTTAQRSGPTIGACGDPRAVECAEFIATGQRNAQFDWVQGPLVAYMPNDRFTVSSSFFWQHLWLYPLAPTGPEFAGAAGLGLRDDVSMRALTAFSLEASWQATRVLGVTGGVYTFSPQLGADSQYLFPLFNRFTTLYLEAALDVETALSSIL